MQKILILEDNAMDRDLLCREIRKTTQSLEFSFAEDEQEFISRLEDPEICLVLSDYYIPPYSGMLALQYCRENYPQLPFVFVTGTIGNEEMAVETILSGAHGFVLKSNLKKITHVLEDLIPEINPHHREDIMDLSKKAILSLKMSLDVYRSTHKDLRERHGIVDSEIASKIKMTRSTIESGSNYLRKILTLGNKKL